jgi:hypothetical protein
VSRDGHFFLGGGGWVLVLILFSSSPSLMASVFVGFDLLCRMAFGTVSSKPRPLGEGGYRTFGSILLQVMVAGLTWGSFRFAAQWVAAISWISWLATRPTINSAGAGSFASLARLDTVVQRICWCGVVALETITQGRSSGWPASVRRRETSA